MWSSIGTNLVQIMVRLTFLTFLKHIVSSLFDAVGFVCCLRSKILMKDRVTSIAQTGFFLGNIATGRLK